MPPIRRSYPAIEPGENLPLPRLDFDVLDPVVLMRLGALLDDGHGALHDFRLPSCRIGELQNDVSKLTAIVILSGLGALLRRVTLRIPGLEIPNQQARQNGARPALFERSKNRSSKVHSNFRVKNREPALPIRYTKSRPRAPQNHRPGRETIRCDSDRRKPDDPLPGPRSFRRLRVLL